MKSLTSIEIPDADNGSTPLRDYRTSSTAQTTVLFRNLEPEAISRIRSADFVVGCVAWLTHPKIMEALTVPRFGASIVVQKEDFLRPDAGRGQTSWANGLSSVFDDSPEINLTSQLMEQRAGGGRGC